MTKTYLATKDETIRAYKSLAEVGNACTESTSMIDIFSAMATPSRLACTITNSSVYPGTSGTLTINKTGANTGTATFVDADGRMSTGVFPWSDWQSPGYSNPNLLINWDFRQPVNQRGQSRYTIPAGGHYTIDMLRSFGGAGALEICDGYITYQGNGGSMFMPLENCSELAGKTVTCSIAAKSENGSMYCGLSVNGSATNTGNASTIDGEDYKILSFTVKLGSSMSTLGVRFGILTNQSSETKVYVRAVKLEMGPVSTLALDLMQPGNYPAELRKCQRYLQALDYSAVHFAEGFGYTQDTTAGNIFMPLVVPMRINKPTISSTDGSNWIIRCARLKVVPTEVISWFASETVLGLRVKGVFPAEHEPFVVEYGSADKLLISAEL